ncbi:MAG: uracil-DNA glycosylase [Limnohabitans sp.]|nr:uracil-DNA glycosylase [Limnohabitans sp.]
MRQLDGCSDLHPQWRDVLQSFWKSDQGQGLHLFLKERYQSGEVIYPPDPYRALRLTPVDQVNVVILGQDPYHGPGQAEGLAFSVAQGVAIPRSLKNIHKELARDLGQALPDHGSLVAWAKRGVLLLNTSLTVADGLPASHAKHGWEYLTDALLRMVAQQKSPCIYMLWGAHAQAQKEAIESVSRESGGESLLLLSNHPSPLSASRGRMPFLGCGHFSKAQSWLANHGIGLDWRL